MSNSDATRAASGAPAYVEGHGLLQGRSVLITAAAGVGIGFAAARRAVEEGCRAIMISDVHERRQSCEELIARIVREANDRLTALAPLTQGN